MCKTVNRVRVVASFNGQQGDEWFENLQEAIRDVRDRMPQRNTGALLANYTFFDHTNKKIIVQFFDDNPSHETYGTLLAEPIVLA